MIGLLCRLLRRRSSVVELAIRKDAAEMVGRLAGPCAKARWRRGVHGRPGLALVVVGPRDDAKLVAAALHRGWRSLRPEGPELDFATAGGRAASAVDAGMDVLLRATVPLDPERVRLLGGSRNGPCLEP
jgi:hypothetical protein